MKENKKLLSDLEFTKLMEEEGLEAGEKYLMELVEQLPDDAVKELYFEMNGLFQMPDDKVNAAFSEMEQLSHTSDDKIEKFFSEIPNPKLADDYVNLIDFYNSSSEDGRKAIMEYVKCTAKENNQ